MIKNVFKNTKPIILVVDDLPENLALLAELLESKGYDVRVSRSGEFALKSLANFTPDLILLDIKMPHLDGYQVCENLKNNPQTAEIPIIFLSALNDTIDKIKAFQIGGIDYVTKPFNAEEVAIRVHNQLTLKQQEKMLKHEIEQRQKIELNLLKANQELQLLNQELEAFSYSVAHDLRNPLSVITSSTDYLLKRYTNQLDDSLMEWLYSIQEAGYKMNTLIESLLVLSHLKKEKLNLETINLSKILSPILNTLETQYSHQKIKSIITPNLRVKGDESLLTIALENLLGNAFKYSSHKDEIYLEFGVTSDFDLSLFSLQYPFIKTPPNLAYFIKDQGVGFDIKKADKIFLPFQRLHQKNQFEGNGIGLSIVKRIIERHQGFIWCDSQPESGSTFYFTLPFL